MTTILPWYTNSMFSNIDSLKDCDFFEHWQEALLICSIAICIIGSLGFLFAGLWIVSTAFAFIGITSYMGLTATREAKQLYKLESINKDLSDVNDDLNGEVSRLSAETDRLKEEMSSCLVTFKQDTEALTDGFQREISTLEANNRNLTETIARLKEDLGDKLTHLERIDQMLVRRSKELAKTTVAYRMERIKLGKIRDSLAREISHLHDAIEALSDKIAGMPQFAAQMAQVISISEKILHSPDV